MFILNIYRARKEESCDETFKGNLGKALGLVDW